VSSPSPSDGQLVSWQVIPATTVRAVAIFLSADGFLLTRHSSPWDDGRSACDRYGSLPDVARPACPCCYSWLSTAWSGQVESGLPSLDEGNPDWVRPETDLAWQLSGRHGGHGRATFRDARRCHPSSSATTAIGYRGREPAIRALSSASLRPQQEVHCL
jgi:hypothetical protein